MLHAGMSCASYETEAVPREKQETKPPKRQRNQKKGTNKSKTKQAIYQRSVRMWA